MKFKIVSSFFMFIALIMVSEAHFQTLIPPTDVIQSIENKIKIDARFTHPMGSGPLMNMKKPINFGVMVNGVKENLLDQIEEVKIEDKSTFKLLYKFNKPGDYIFYIEPAPYWEPAEEKMIIHYTKVIVDVLGAEEGWDDLVGLPVEIEPLSRPYSIYTGNIFQGIVRKNGKPVPFAEIEIEYLNEDGKVKSPSDVYVTQVIKADTNGLFSYAIPKSGWWGFAALVEGDQKMKNPQGKEVDVELGALIWIKAEDLITK